MALDQADEPPKPFHCLFEGCNKSFRRRDKLEIHTRCHTGERPFVCEIEGCLKAFVRNQHLSRHMERSHSTFEEKEAQRVKCPQCQAELANSQCLYYHMRKHTNGKPDRVYKCTELGCDEAFRKKTQLVAHRIKHTGSINLANKCHKCPSEGCGKMFDSPHRVKVHMKVHQGYPCDVEGCLEVLSTCSARRKHKATEHATVNTCPICGVVFNKMSNLHQHMVVHDGDRQLIKCEVEGCGRGFLYKKNLTFHVKSFHEKKTAVKRKSKQRSKINKDRKPSRKSTAASWLSLDDRGGILKVNPRASSETKASFFESCGGVLEIQKCDPRSEENCSEDEHVQLTDSSDKNHWMPCDRQVHDIKQNVSIPLTELFSK